MRGGGFGWLRGLALPAGMVVMDTCCIVPWAFLIGQWVRLEVGTGVLSPGAILLLRAGSQAVSITVLGRNWPLVISRIALVLFGFASTLLAAYLHYYTDTPLADPAWLVALANGFVSGFQQSAAPALSLATGFFLCWRGISYGHGNVQFDDFERTFKLGFVALAVFLLVCAAMAASNYPTPGSASAIYIVGHLFVGLVTLFLARVAVANERSLSRGGKAVSLSRESLVMVLGAVLVLLLVTLGLARPFSFDIITAVGNSTFDLVGAVLRLLVLAISLPLALIAWVLWLIKSLLPAPTPPEEPPPPVPDPNLLRPDVIGERIVWTIPPELVIALKWALLGLTVVSIAVLLAWAVSRWRPRDRDDEVDEDRGSIFSWALFKDDLLTWLRSLVRVFSRKRQEIMSAWPRVSAQSGPKPERFLGIREIYRELLRLGALVGSARSLHATPHEHLPRLQERLRPADDLAMITEAYVRARYGRNPLSDTETEDALARWRRVQSSSMESTQPVEGQGDDSKRKRSGRQG